MRRKPSSKVKGCGDLRRTRRKQQAEQQARRPIHCENIDTAIKKAKPGATIYLAAGVLTPKASGSCSTTNLTIIGADERRKASSHRRAATAIDVNHSTGITLDNLWLRAEGSGGVGTGGAGSSVTVNRIETDQCNSNGVGRRRVPGRHRVVGRKRQATSIRSRPESACSCEEAQAASINGCTFDNDGTAPNVTTLSNGMVLTGNAQVNVVNSQFNGNTNVRLGRLADVAGDGPRMHVQRQSTQAMERSSSTRQPSNLQNNTFSSNGEVAGPTTGLDGVELNNDFTGTALIEGNSFLGNTGDGLYIGSAPEVVQVLDNVFQNNFVGVALNADGTTCQREQSKATAFPCRPARDGRRNPRGTLRPGERCQRNGRRRRRSGRCVFQIIVDYCVHTATRTRATSPTQVSRIPQPGYSTGIAFVQNGVAIPQSLAVGPRPT